MAKSVQIDKICAYLSATSTVANVVGDRIYFGEPMREQSGTYIVINSISEVSDITNKKALVEFRIIGSNENVRKKTLVDIANILTDAMVTTDTTQIYNFSGFQVFKVVEGGDFRIFVDEKNRNLLIKDYIFYFLQ